VKGNESIDLFAQKNDEKIAIEVETGKSDIKANLQKSKDAGFDKVILIATSPSAVTACQKAIKKIDAGKSIAIEQLSWLDIS